MNPRLKLGLVGAGPVAIKYHVPAIRAVPEVFPFIVADADASRAKALAQKCPFARWTTDYEELCGSVDLAVVALPNMLHQPVSCRLLESGVHVLCEKPMARTVEECNRMIASAKICGRVLCVGHNRRFRHNILKARRLLTDGIIGTVTEVNAEEGSVSDWPRSPAYFDPIQAGGGALLDVGIHAIDLIRWLVAEFADLDYEGNQTARLVESEAELRFVLDNGARGKILCSRNRNLPNTLTLVGTEGKLITELWGHGLTIRTNRGKAFARIESLRVATSRRAADSSFVEQLSQFATAVQTNSISFGNGVAGMKAVEVVEQAYQTKIRTGESAAANLHATPANEARIISAECVPCAPARPRPLPIADA